MHAHVDQVQEHPPQLLSICCHPRATRARAEHQLHAAGLRHGAKEMVGVAQQFSEIVGVPPHGVLLLLKNGPGAHLKKNRYDYQTALNKEIARIEHIQQLRAQMLGLVGVLLTSAFIGIATLSASEY